MENDQVRSIIGLFDQVHNQKKLSNLIDQVSSLIADGIFCIAIELISLILKLSYQVELIYIVELVILNEFNENWLKIKVILSSWIE